MGVAPGAPKLSARCSPRNSSAPAQSLLIRGGGASKRKDPAALNAVGVKPGSRRATLKAPAAWLVLDLGQRRGQNGAAPPPGGSPPPRGLNPAPQEPRGFPRPRQLGAREGGRCVVPGSPHRKVSRLCTSLRGWGWRFPSRGRELGARLRGRMVGGERGGERGRGGSEMLGFPHSGTFVSEELKMTYKCVA